jgi:acyl-CoA synthetase (AMP-forming)/AMP-acid ligase II
MLEPLQKIFPNALIFKMYGLTECKRATYLEPELLEDYGDSVGKAIPGTEVFITSPDGERLPPGNEGILHIRGPHVMPGYWRRPEQSAHMLVPGNLPGEQVLCTHDLFRMDHDGFLYFIGRTDDIIKSRGEKVAPLEVEKVLLTVEGIKEAAVIGVPDKVLGQAIKAFITVDTENAPTIPLIKKTCIAHLENFMVPKFFDIIDNMPKSPNGKIDKKVLASKSEKP